MALFFKTFMLHILLGVQLAIAPSLQHQNGMCRKASVAILGAGLTGITAAQALTSESVTDFVIVDVNSYLGGRVKHSEFGKDPDGNPYTIELGANWVQGLGSLDGPDNPIWLLVQKYDLANTYSNFSSILTYDQTGANDYTDLLDDYDKAYSLVEAEVGSMLSRGHQGRSFRVGLSLAGWKPRKNMLQQAAEWWRFDWEYSHSPDLTSETFSVVVSLSFCHTVDETTNNLTECQNYNRSVHQFSHANNYIHDSRGYNTFIQGEASTFLKPEDNRVLLNTRVTAIDYSDQDSVTITMSDESCITATYAICTFSLGVLQNEVVEFSPPFPSWKQEGIEGMQMGTFTKIFLQFPPDQQFWDADIQFFLYADPTERGLYPIWQSLSGPAFLPGSGILFVTVVQSQSYRVESQPDEVTQTEIMAVLKKMFGDDIPDPIDFMYPRWSTEPWAYGSYSNWPPGLSIETHQNLRANLGHLYFAGEATSVEYFGFLQGKESTSPIPLSKIGWWSY